MSRTDLELVEGVLRIADFRQCALVFMEFEDWERTAFSSSSRLEDPGAIAVARQSATVIRRMGPARDLQISEWALGD